MHSSVLVLPKAECCTGTYIMNHTHLFCFPGPGLVLINEETDKTRLSYQVICRLVGNSDRKIIRAILKQLRQMEEKQNGTDSASKDQEEHHKDRSGYSQQREDHVQRGWCSPLFRHLRHLEWWARAKPNKQAKTGTTHYLVCFILRSSDLILRSFRQKSSKLGYAV